MNFFAFLLFLLLAIFLISGYPVALTLAGTAIFVAIIGYFVRFISISFT